MATTATLVDARVKYEAGQPREGKYGPYISALCTLADGTEQRIFGEPGDAIANLKRGQNIKLLWNGKKYQLVETQQPTPTQPATPATAPAVAGDGSQALSKGQKKQIAGYVEEMANLYKFCWDSASTALDGKANDEESIRAAASALFISASRKFGL